MKTPVKLGLYGCGNRTRGLLEALEGEGACEVVSAYDLRSEAATGLCERFGGKPCGSAAEMLAAKGVEAVVISLDPFSHAAAFFEAVELGKPIFLEKPIAIEFRDVRRILDTARARKVPVHVGLIHRYYPAYQAVRRHLAERDPGRVFSMIFNWHHAGETEMINCHNLNPGNFRLKLSQIPFHCCHALDLYHVFIGDVAAVDARGIKAIPRDYPSPDEVIALLEFKNGAIGHFHYSSFAYGPLGPSPACLHAENYTVVCGPSTWDVSYRPPHASLRGELKKEDCRQGYYQNVGPVHQKFELNHYNLATADAMTDFLTSVRTGAPMKVPIEDGYWVAELAEAIERSWKERRRIELPLAAP